MKETKDDCLVFFFFQAEDGIRDLTVTGVQTCALPILPSPSSGRPPPRPGAEERRQGCDIVVARAHPDGIEGELAEQLVAAIALLLRSEEHTSELQSQSNLVCRLLLEKKMNSHLTVNNL